MEYAAVRVLNRERVELHSGYGMTDILMLLVLSQGYFPSGRTHWLLFVSDMPPYIPYGWMLSDRHVGCYTQATHMLSHRRTELHAAGP